MTQVTAQSRAARSPWVARRASLLAFLMSAVLFFTFTPLTLTTTVLDLTSTAFIAVFALALWASFMACWLTHRRH